MKWILAPSTILIGPAINSNGKYHENQLAQELQHPSTAAREQDGRRRPIMANDKLPVDFRSYCNAFQNHTQKRKQDAIHDTPNFVKWLVVNTTERKGVKNSPFGWNDATCTLPPCEPWRSRCAITSKKNNYILIRRVCITIFTFEIFIIAVKFCSMRPRKCPGRLNKWITHVEPWRFAGSTSELLQTYRVTLGISGRSRSKAVLASAP
jgi:hypothetical protein